MSCGVQGDLLSFLSPRLLQNLSSFTPPTAATTKLLQAGEVKSSFPNEQGVYESQVLHEDWKRIVLEFSAAMVSHIDVARHTRTPIPAHDVNNY